MMVGYAHLLSGNRAVKEAAQTGEIGYFVYMGKGEDVGASSLRSIGVAKGEIFWHSPTKVNLRGAYET